jgi:hypothetical protein
VPYWQDNAVSYYTQEQYVPGKTRASGNVFAKSTGFSTPVANYSKSIEKIE